MKIIWGQQDYAERIACYLEEILPGEELRTLPFPTPNPTSEFFDFSHYDVALTNVDRDVSIIVAFGTEHQQNAIEYLKKMGFWNFQFFNAIMDNQLKKPFLKKIFAKQGKEISFIGEEKSVIIYMAKSIVDKPLRNYPKCISSHIVPLQVGSALTERRIATLTDDIGDNISCRNQHYSETTALYWMWKNAEADYLGLCHYRRMWKDLDKIADNLQNYVADIVLPIPTWMVPTVMEGHLKKYTPEVWETMMDVLKRHSPEYYKAAQTIFGGNIFYASNMLIAKRHVLHQLCSWMFPIVMEVEAQVGDLPDKYYNRYCGFCTEQLITLYFLYNKQNYRISHAEKIFIE